MLNGRPKARVHALVLLLAMMIGVVFTSEGEANELVPVVEHEARERLVTWARDRGLANPKVEVVVRMPAEAGTSCAASWKVAAVDARVASRLRFLGTCPDDGRSFRVPVRAVVQAGAWKLVHSLPKAHRLAAGDVEATQVDVLSLGDAVVTDQAPQGELKQRLQAGAILQVRHLAEVGGIRRGEGVQLMSGGASFRVIVAATALDAGSPGQLIRVRNVASGKTVRARIVGVGVVEAVRGGS